MPAEKAELLLRPTTSVSDSADGSDVSSPSHSTPDQSSDHSESDSLDSQGSRKRRRKSATQDENDEPPIPSIPTVSRVKSSVAKAYLPVDHRKSNGATLAPTDPQTTFSALDVKPWLVGSLGSMAIKRPTGIQKGCIPEILKGRDCIGGSRTGSGKTVAFAVPVLQKWAEDPFGIFALVLTPTRYGS